MAVFSGIYAGFMIGLGATAKLLCSNPYVGSFLFCIGLCTVLAFRMELYTGQIGRLLYSEDGCFRYNVERLGAMLVGNLLGAILCAFLVSIARPELPEQVNQMMHSDLAAPLHQTFCLAFFCGVCMYIAVMLNPFCEEMPKGIGIFLGVPVFILCGYKHSIAETFYYALGLFSSNVESYASLQGILYLVICILGNTVGSLLASLYIVMHAVTGSKKQ